MISDIIIYANDTAHVLSQLKVLQLMENTIKVERAILSLTHNDLAK